jgi:hypothetical protein
MACGGGDGPSTSTLEDLCGEDTGAFSQLIGKVLECNPEFTLFLGEVPTEAEIAGACNSQFGSFVDDGSIEFGEKAALDACLAAVVAADCETFEIDHIPECSEVNLGQLELGTDCESSDQCAGDAYCTAPALGASCGVCTAILADGETCVDGDDCLNGNCRTNGTCGPFVASGGTCEDTEDCAGRLQCNDGTCGTALVASVGDACVEFGDCGFPSSDLFCNESAMMCEAFIALDATCNDGAINTGLCNLIKYESCDSTGTRKCVAPTEVGMGDQCGFSTGRKCEAGLLCNDPGGAGGRCAATGLGAACTSGSESETCGFFLECKDNNVCGYEDEYTGMCPAAS